MPVDFLKKLEFLFKPATLKVAYGGRGGGKTEGFAQALIVLACTKKLRIACFREFQKSIDESTYQTLVNRIRDMGLEQEFEIQAKTIISKRTGSEFIFMGLRYNIESIKSLARIDIAWVDEARNTSKNSLDKLEPTIRGQYKEDEMDRGGPFGYGPEIWISFNPELDGDEVYKRFVIKKDQYAPEYITNPRNGQKERYSYVVKIDYTDNRFLPVDLEIKANLLKDTNEDEFLHIYGGHTKIVLDGAIYADEIKKVLREGRRGKVPYDPQRVCHTFWDLGHDDHTAIWFIQQVGVEYNAINYFQDRLKKIPYYIKVLQDLGYNYGKHYLPHDGDNETLAGRSPKKQIQDAYPEKVKIVPRVAKKVHGIRAARVIFDLVNFSEENTADGWQCLCNYAYKVDADSGSFSREPDHDTPWSHGCFTEDTKILTREGSKAISTLPETGEAWTLLGWKKFLNPHLTRKNAPLVEVHFTNGYMVKCTPDHLFLTVAKEWKSAENLMPGLMIQSGLQKTYSILIEKFIEKINRVTTHVLINFIEKFGKKLLDKYQKTVTYIIETKLNQIINFITLNVYQKKNIYLIPLNVNGRMVDLDGFQMKLDLLPQNGISHQKVNSGIFNKPLLHGQSKQNFVLSVGNNLKECLNKSFVAQNVLKYFIKKKEQQKQKKYTLEQKIKNVKNAIYHLFKSLKEAAKINYFAQQDAGTLIIKNVKSLPYSQDVWCITVPNCGHFALANGAIVKNCDAFQTFALSLKSETVQKKPRVVGVGRQVVPFRQQNSWMG